MATTPRRRRAAPAADQPPADLPTAEAVSLPDATPAPAPKPRRRKAAEPAVADAAVEPVAAPAAEPTPDPVAVTPQAPATPRKKAPARKRTRAAAEPVAEPATDAPATDAPVVAAAADPAEPAPAEAPAARAGRSRRRRAEPAPAEDAPAHAEPVADAPAAAAPEAGPEPEPVAEPLAPEPAPEPPADPVSRLTLETQADGRRVLRWQPAPGCPDTLRQSARRHQTADGGLALTEPEALDELLAVAARCGHPLAVDEAVWRQLALRGDLRARIEHLERSHPQGLEGLTLPEPVTAPPRLAPRPAQLEAAFFAACAGACMLADEAGLEPDRELALAWRLVSTHFGAARLVVRAAPARWAEWQALLAPLGDAPAPLLRDAAAAWTEVEAQAEALIVDLRDAWHDAPAADTLSSPWLWVLAPAAGLADAPAATGWLAALDRLGSGAVAQGLAQADPERLAPLLLQRGWAEVAEQWPAWAPQDQVCPWPSEDHAGHRQALEALQAPLQRWQRSRFLSDSEQLGLLATLARAEAAELETVLVSLPDLLAQALAQGRRRVVAFAQAAGAAELSAAAEWLAESGWQAELLPATHREAEPVLRRFREADGPSLLLVTDGLAGSEPRIPTAPEAPLVLHLDRPWDEAVRERRLQRLRVPRSQRTVPVWQLLAPDSLSARRQAQLAGAAAEAPPPAPSGRLRRGEALAAWLDGLCALLLSAAAAPCTPSP